MDAKEWLGEVYFPQKRTGEELAKLVTDAISIIEEQNREIAELSEANEELKQQVNRRIACQEREAAIKRVERAEAEAAVMREALEEIVTIGGGMIDTYDRYIFKGVTEIARKALAATAEESNND